MRFKLRTGEAYEIEALPFGLSCSPYWAHRLSKVIPSWIRNNLPGVSIVWYVDDIAILGETELQVERMTTALINFLTTLGIEVNSKKSMKQAVEQFDYLGQTISPPPSKLKKALNLAKKQLKTHTCVPHHLARLGGVRLNLQRRVQNMLGIAKLLMMDTAKAPVTLIKRTGVPN